MAWWPAVTFLAGVYWPYLVAAAAIGLVVGWLSVSRAEKPGMRR